MRNRKEIEDEIEELAKLCCLSGEYPIVTSARVEAILEVVLDIRDFLIKEVKPGGKDS